MIVVADRLGQLGNRLFQFAHLIAFAAEHNIRVANPGFQDYAEDFPAFADDALCRWPPPRLRVPTRWREGVLRQTNRLLILAERGVPIPTIAGPLALRDFRPRRLALATGWEIRDEPNFKKHAPLLRHLFTPTHRHAAAADAVVGNLPRPIIGIHIRRGDYERWANGKFFWPADVYARIATDIREAGGTPLACSDDRELLHDLGDLVVPGPGHAVADLWALSRCDAIVGPPSTFSAWAAFQGDIPVQHLEHREQALELIRAGESR